MSTTHTGLSVGKTYAVTSPNGCTVTDERGNQVATIEAGKQGFFTAQTPAVVVDDDSALVTRSFDGAPASQGSGGGMPAAPTPEPLPASGELKHGHVYLATATDGLDLSGLTVEQYATAELWIDYTAGSVTLGAWTWPDDDEPSAWTAGNRYCLVLRNDGASTLAAINYNYPLQ